MAKRPGQLSQTHLVVIPGARWRTDGTWDGTWRNDHWAEYYYMGALLAHTIVVVLDTAWVKSKYCQGELALFLENVRHAYDEAKHAEFPGSRFQVVVVYDSTPGTVCDGENCRHDGLVPGTGTWYHCSRDGPSDRTPRARGVSPSWN